MDHVFATYILYYVTLLHLLILRVRDIAAPLLAGMMPFWSLQHAMCSTFDSKVFFSPTVKDLVCLQATALN